MFTLELILFSLLAVTSLVSFSYAVVFKHKYTELKTSNVKLNTQLSRSTCQANDSQGVTKRQSNDSALFWKKKASEFKKQIDSLNKKLALHQTLAIDVKRENEHRDKIIFNLNQHCKQLEQKLATIKSTLTTRERDKRVKNNTSISSLHHRVHNMPQNQQDKQSIQANNAHNPIQIHNYALRAVHKLQQAQRAQALLSA